MEHVNLRTGKHNCEPLLLRSTAISKTSSILLILVSLAISHCCGGGNVMPIEESLSGVSH